MQLEKEINLKDFQKKSLWQLKMALTKDLL